MLVDGVQLVVIGPEQRLAHGQRVDIGILVPADTRLLPALRMNSISKLWALWATRMLSPQNSLEGADGFLRRGGVGDHGVIDAGQVNDLLRDGLAGVDEGAELLFLR